MQLHEIAKVCHEANRAYCQAIGDDSQVAWEEAPDWQRQSAMAGVEFNLANPNAPASATHESWLAKKVADGWKYGPAKDPDKKEHPCCVPYGHLPNAQQRKDMMFKAIVASLCQPMAEYAAGEDS